MNNAAAADTIVPRSDWNNAAYRACFEQLYEQLRHVARRELSGKRRTTLSTTLLVHEAFLKLDGCPVNVSERGPFLALAAKAIRCVLVDHFRAVSTHKRGGDLARVTLMTDLAQDNAQSEIDVLDIERALQALELLDPPLASVVELHYYAGMEFTEIAQQLELTQRTIHRDWRKARAFLLTHLGNDAP